MTELSEDSNRVLTAADVRLALGGHYELGGTDNQ